MKCYKIQVPHRLSKSIRLDATVKNIPCAKETKETVKTTNAYLQILQVTYKLAKNAAKNTGGTDQKNTGLPKRCSRHTILTTIQLKLLKYPTVILTNNSQCSNTIRQRCEKQYKFLKRIKYLGYLCKQLRLYGQMYVYAGHKMISYGNRKICKPLYFLKKKCKN